MAQATHVTSAIGTLATGENATQSTNPFPAVHTKIASTWDLRSLIHAIHCAFSLRFGRTS
jgi:hypothetical protein